MCKWGMNVLISLVLLGVSLTGRHLPVWPARLGSDLVLRSHPWHTWEEESDEDVLMQHYTLCVNHTPTLVGQI